MEDRATVPLTPGGMYPLTLRDAELTMTAFFRVEMRAAATWWTF